MTKDDVRVLADQLLKPILGPVGFTSSDVEEGESHAGEDAFFVSVHFAPGSTVAEGRAYNDAQWGLWTALQERGERRFPYFELAYQEEPADDGEDELEPNDGS